MKFYFDQSARVQFWCEGDSKDQAIEKFIQTMNDSGMEITVDSFEPDKIEGEQDDVEIDD